jgi:hypothetical protein
VTVTVKAAPEKSLEISPASVSISTGAKTTFTATPTDGVTWSATGGSITDGGVYTAGNAAGSFTVTAKAGSLTATADVTITADSGLPPHRSLVSLFWEAENTTVTGKDMGFYIATRKEVAGGKVSGGKVLATPKLDPGEKITDPDAVTYQVKIPQDGTYYLWGRCIWSTGCGNTFNIRVEGSTSGQWILGGDSTYDVLHWICLSDGGDNADSPRPLALKAGTVTITLGQRESATQVDEFMLSTDAKKRPAGDYLPTADALVP